MSKFCGNCGAVADDNAMVCGSCGTPFAPVQPNYQPPVQPGYNPMPGAPVMNQNIPGVTNNGAKKNGVIPKIIAAVLAVVILVVGVVAIIGNKSKSDYETVIKEYAHAIETGNAKKYVEMMYIPKEYKEWKDEIIEEKIMLFQGRHDYWAERLYSDDFKVSYKITENKKLSKADVYEEFGFDDIDKDCLYIEAEFTFKSEYDSDSDDCYAFLLVDDGSWKIYFLDMF